MLDRVSVAFLQSSSPDRVPKIEFRSRSPVDNGDNIEVTKFFERPLLPLTLSIRRRRRMRDSWLRLDSAREDAQKLLGILIRSISVVASSIRRPQRQVVS